MKAIVGKVVTEDAVIDGGCVVFDEKSGKITAVGKTVPDGCDVTDFGEKYILPGLIDIHIHGYVGCDASDADADGLRKISTALTANGVTAWCPTTMTVDADIIRKALYVIGMMIGRDNGGAQILGANVEGPFINSLKKGAQDEKYVLPPNADFIINNRDKIKLVTVAPEVDGGIEFVKKVSRESGVTVSVGHSAADYQAAKAAFENGASHVTHLFNAMTVFTHRAPGIVGAALDDDGVSCELIADCYHVNPCLFKMLCRTKREKLVLITDCMRAGGMPDGEYTLGGQAVTVHGNSCLLSDGTIAGSVLTLNRAVKNLHEHGGISLREAVNAASIVPARVIHEDSERGSISVGKRADIAVADENMNILLTFVGGKEVYKSEGQQI